MLSSFQQKDERGGVPSPLPTLARNLIFKPSYPASSHSGPKHLSRFRGCVLSFPSHFIPQLPAPFMPPPSNSDHIHRVYSKLVLTQTLSISDDYLPYLLVIIDLMPRSVSTVAPSSLRGCNPNSFGRISVDTPGFLSSPLITILICRPNIIH